MSTPSSAHMRGLMYVFTLISVGIVFGRISEVCADDNECPARPATIVGFAVLSFVMCVPLILATALDKVPASAEAALSTLLVLFTTVSVGVSSSARTLSRYPYLLEYPLGFAWLAEVLSIITWYLVGIEALVCKEKVVKERQGVESRNTGDTGAVETVAEASV